MSVIGKGTLSYRKIDTKQDKSLALGVKKLVFAHQFSGAGITDVDLLSLTTPPDLTTLGFVNPNLAESAEARLLLNRESIRVVSSLKGVLMDYISYDVISNTKIRLKNGAESTNSDEILFIHVEPANYNGAISVDGTTIISTGTVAVGLTDFVVGEPFEVNKYSTTQLGDVLVFRDGVLQMRCVGNTLAGAGNYIEVLPVAGLLSNTIRLKDPVVGTDANIVVVSNGLRVERPTAAVLSKFETLAGQMDIVIEDLAAATGNPTTRYQTAPNSVDLKMFGELLKSLITDGIYDAVVGSAAQVAAGLAQFTSLQTAINTVSAGDKILLLQGTYAENITVSKKVMIEGKGHGSYINGTLTFDANSDYSLVKWLKVSGNITLQAGADGIFLRECWQATGSSVTDNGLANSVLVIEE